MGAAMSPEALRKLILGETLTATRAEINWRKDTCVLSCIVAHYALKRFGLNPKYRPVILEAYSPGYVAAAEAGVPEAEMDPAKCRVVAAGRGRPEGGGPGGWDGHLVLIEGEVLLDPSLDQCNRPEYGMALVPAAFPIPDPPGFERGEPLTGRLNGSLIRYVPDPGNQVWRGGKDWRDRHKIQREHGGKVIERVAAAIKAAKSDG